jgi:vitamin B12/bleomycin/antimicrobial peptide transport system ATP-binding/permease protein
MQRFNLTIVKQFWSIANRYWFSEEKWRARGLLLLVILLSLGYTGLSVLLNNKRGALISALSAKDEAVFWQTILVFTGTLVVYAPLYAGYVYLRDRLGLHWREWLTKDFIDRYFENRAFYQLNHSEDNIDNPDQRITEDAKSFTNESLGLLLAIVDSLLAIAAFSAVLWGISRPLILFLVIYACIGSLTTVGVFGKPLMRLNFGQLKKEADFRFSLVRIRENAEAIAFYQGEAYEADRIKARFLEVVENFKRLIIWELNLNILSNAYEFIPFVLPAIVVAPGIFAGELEIGKVTEAQGAFIRVFFSLNLIVGRFQSLATFSAGVERLYTFLAALDKPVPVDSEQTEAIPDCGLSRPRKHDAPNPKLPANLGEGPVDRLALRRRGTAAGTERLWEKFFAAGNSGPVGLRRRQDYPTRSGPNAVPAPAALHGTRHSARSASLSKHQRGN